SESSGQSVAELHGQGVLRSGSPQRARILAEGNGADVETAAGLGPHHEEGRTRLELPPQQEIQVKLMVGECGIREGEFPRRSRIYDKRPAVGHIVDPRP